AESDALIPTSPIKTADVGTLAERNIERPIGSVKIVQEGVADILSQSETSIVWPVEPTQGNTVLIAYLKDNTKTITKPAGSWVERVAPVAIGADSTREISVETVTVPASSGTTWNWDIVASTGVLGIAAIEIEGENLGGTLLIETIVDTASPYVGGPLDGDATPVGEYFYVLIGGSLSFGAQPIAWTDASGFTERSNDATETATNWALTLFTQTTFDTQPNATLSIDDDGTGAAILIGIPAAVPSVVSVGTLVETDTLIVIAVVQEGGQEIAVTTLAELEALIAIQAIKVVPIGTLAEIDALVSAGVSIFETIGTLAEIDSLIAAGVSLFETIGTLAEIEALLAIQARKVANIGTLGEIESLIPVGVSIFRTIGTMAEVEVLLAIQARKIANIGTLGEADSLLAIQARKVANIGTLGEADSLIVIVVEQAGGQDIAVTTLAEIEALLAIQARKIANITASLVQ
ncbi:hypothetical protein LCGC14_2386340, partial [marine sediment metagenome]